MTERPERQYRARYHARWVLPVSAPPIEDGTVVVEMDRITYVGPRAGAPLARDVELGDAVITPGLVNTHTHLDLTVLRGLPQGLTFFDWIRGLVAARDRLTPGEQLDSARLGVREGLQAGITTYADTAPSDAPLGAMLELGVRGIAYREVFGPDPAKCEAALSELRRNVAAMRARETRFVGVGVSPHAPYSVSDALYRAVADFARAQQLPLATHIAESADESRLVGGGEGPFAEFLRGRGISVSPRARTPVALLKECDVLGRNALLIHCVRADAEDIATIAGTGCGVATCPVSNRFFAHGAAPVGDLLAAGVRVGVGTDSMASNDRMDVWHESLLAAGFALAGGVAPGHGDHRGALELATLGGARALGLDDRIGSLEAGKQADIAVFPLPRSHTPRPADRDARAAGAPIMPAVLVLVAGRELVRGGRLANWRPPPPFH
ncbi:MAG TPA: amidohydrolase family protein [Gemmatimonadaceae bacterium]|nr:amidohydrolase family protein [Gemmatimonadaceae bacterium]